jgi:hypothetical protein
MPEQPKPTREEIDAAFAEADDAFWGDRSVVFGSEPEKKRRLFENLKRVSRHWDRPGPCMYQGCGEPSIRRSHAIHRAGPLERIAEDQHVLTPRLDSSGQMKMERIGLNLASTFPGFCVKHEQLFSEFETAGSVSSERHLALQAYRTLCREIASKDHMVRQLEPLLDQYRQAREDHYVTTIQKRLPGMTFSSLVVKGDGLEKRLVRMLSGAKADLAELHGELHDDLFAYINGQRREPSLQALSIPFELPVSLSGFGVLRYKRAREKRARRALCLLGILPQERSTIAFIGSARKHADVVEAYRSSMIHGFNGLNAMESWMTNGSDHWFIRPSAWEAISPTRQAKVIKLLLSEEDNIGTFLDFSILDNVRKTIISFIRTHLADAPNRELALRMVAVEEAKLTR